ncbi:hypothetical protein [Granulosicoccus antarcticus]|uniref:Uncharacterized protein n=1 Tax=Granulosicoccus antarcticus IMCC3135 TaxID=1192854 RepID=A0A2Z2NIV5_9GAMM|nr:hypothetical protein [Granulosicoccus antarcticus]ASJ71089.1 hypothetical protein IMCC3135_04880 [Granulosicoccus antarcticus IMCC3135]
MKGSNCFYLITGLVLLVVVSWLLVPWFGAEAFASTFSSFPAKYYLAIQTALLIAFGLLFLYVTFVPPEALYFAYRRSGSFMALGAVALINPASCVAVRLADSSGNTLNIGSLDDKSRIGLSIVCLILSGFFGFLYFIERRFVDMEERSA